MGGQDIRADFADIVKVMTSTITKTLSDSVQSYDSDVVNIQTNDNSSGCRNIDRQSTKSYYYVSSSVFADELTYQNTVLNMVQQLADTQQNKADGGLLSGKQTDQFYAMILDIITTKLSSSTMVKIGQNTSSININVQHCDGSDGGLNYIIGTQKNVIKYYDKLYSQDATLQSVAADISNYINGTQSNKKTGFLVTLIRMIAIVIIGVVVLAIVIVGAYLVTLKGG